MAGFPCKTPGCTVWVLGHVGSRQITASTGLFCCMTTPATGCKADLFTSCQQPLPTASRPYLPASRADCKSCTKVAKQCSMPRTHHFNNLLCNGQAPVIVPSSQLRSNCQLRAQAPSPPSGACIYRCRSSTASQSRAPSSKAACRPPGARPSPRSTTLI